MDTPQLHTTPSGTLFIKEDGEDRAYEIAFSANGTISVYEKAMRTSFIVPFDTWHALHKAIVILENSTQSQHKIELP